MQWLRRLLTPQEPPSQALKRTVAELHEEVRAVQTEVNALRKEWASEQLALADLIAKMNAWVGRLAARERNKAARQLEAETSGEADQAAPQLQAGPMSKAQLRALVAARMTNGGGR